jgi:hypothetical protein
MTDLNDILSLAEAGADLGLSPSTLKNQVAKGVLRARCVGKTWITTRDEVARYRRDHLGQVGRPEGARDSQPQRCRRQG